MGKENIPESVVQLAIADDIIKIGRANSLWPLTFGIACCAIEMMATGGSRFDMSRFGAEVFRPSPRQADLLIIAGTVTKKMQPGIKTLYDQMPEPKWVMAMGNCAISGGPFAIKENYNVVLGADTFLPVDIYVPGCPPRPEGLLQGIIELEELVSDWKRFKDPEKAHSRQPSIRAQADKEV
ncbi:NADH-quinone oxidoreductase subunit B [Desulforhopalus vacuolatus]|uniref:NADH-quinone oxidoreductase subunit B n=1 Tax=Desulforhopalus vacuolatus TaxID=40414 RepID=UPI0030845576